MPGAAARGGASLAARSARGGTTGRAAGCPASGRAGGLGADGIGAPGAGDGPVPAVGCGALGARPATPGRVKIGADGGDGWLTPAGIGCRGPDKTWPGRGCGTGLATGGAGRPGGGAGGGAAGATRATGAAGGGGAGGGDGCATGGALPARGGRMGCAGRPAGRSNEVLAADGSAAFSSTAGRGGVWPNGLAGVTSGAGDVTTAGAGRSGGAAARPSGSGRSSGISPPNIRRSFRATSSSIELEWVFFSVTPNSGSLSRISCALTSSSRASSLMRILFINTKL